MLAKKYLLIICITVSIGVIYLLVSGSSILLYNIMQSPYLPAGTLITWLGLIAFTSVFKIVFSSLKWSSSIALSICYSLFQIAFVLAILWFPISIALSGNLSNSFSETTTFQGGNWL